MILSVISVACLGALVVVATVKSVDTLSTVALALAVISFAAQLIVTLAQGQQSAQLNSETKAALTEMRANAASLLANQSGQFNTVLNALIGQARTAYEEATTGEPGDGQSALEAGADLSQTFGSRFADALARGIVQAAQAQSSQSRQPPGPNSLAGWRVLLQSYPSREEGEPVVGILRNLSGGAMARLAELVSSSMNSLRPDRAATYQGAAGQQDENPENQQLIDAGLIERIAASSATGRTIYQFTPSGVLAARLIRGVGERPEWASLG